MSKKQKPFERIIYAQQMAKVAADHGMDMAVTISKDFKTPQDVLKEISECFDFLVALRNHVAMMAKMDEPPEEYISYIASLNGAEE